MNQILKKLSFLILLLSFSTICFSQNISQQYKPLKSDSLRIGKKENDFLPFIQAGYTLMLPENKGVVGVLIFLEDSGYDQKNNNAKQMYKQASKAGFAVLSVSSEIPFDFYFFESSMQSTHNLIVEAFIKNNLPNKNIFFLGGSLVGHRGLRYIKFIKEKDFEFQLNIKGIAICNFTLDWTRKWHQHRRDIRIDRIDLWEPKFINYMLETHLKGTPKTAPNNYHNFSTYSYFDEQNRNIKLYKNYAVLAYIEPAINFRLKKYFRTLYENNATDIVGFLAELELAGNERTELVVLHPEKNSAEKKTVQSTWNTINKDRLMKWIMAQKKN
ncbi:hypothetical protein [Winogradskyella sp. PE311]|uniref:hypothetical protein n=1 Tax=Winogradskyella sp. PE311 TaxID=3366943 RepID=UPI00397EC993